MHEYRQLPIKEFEPYLPNGRSFPPPESKKDEPWNPYILTNSFDSTEVKKKDEWDPYQLDRRGFLDAVWNRIHAVRFSPTGSNTIGALPNKVDHFGRVQVLLWLNSSETLESQSESLVHEMIHIDRKSWGLVKNIPFFTELHSNMRIEEEEIVERATQEFYNSHKDLAKLALNHVWQRREES